MTVSLMRTDRLSSEVAALVYNPPNSSILEASGLHTESLHHAIEMNLRTSESRLRTSSLSPWPQASRLRPRPHLLQHPHTFAPKLALPPSQSPSSPWSPVTCSPSPGARLSPSRVTPKPRLLHESLGGLTLQLRPQPRPRRPAHLQPTIRTVRCFVGLASNSKWKRPKGGPGRRGSGQDQTLSFR